jgi:hypothetical protein
MLLVTLAGSYDGATARRHRDGAYVQAALFS